MKRKSIDRRKFLKSAAVTTVGAGMASRLSFAGSSTTAKSSAAPKIQEYRTFGKTGFQVSDFSIGAPSNEAVLKACLDRGANLIDAGETYGNGNTERLIGKVLKDYDRSKLFINSKLYSETGEFPSKKDVIERTHAVLERLQTDYVDCMQIHSAESSAILKDKAFHEGMEQMKKEGKVKYVGVSCHGNNWAYDTREDIEKILMTAVDDGRFDVILLAYNFVNAEKAERILEACEKKNIATMIMKSNPVHVYSLMENRVKQIEAAGKEVDEYTQLFYDKYKVMNEQALNFFRRYGVSDETELKSAASKYVLSNPKAHTTLWAFDNFEQMEWIMNLSGQKLNQRDALVLNGYKKELGHTQCLLGCNDCEEACPHHIPINKVMRYNYYFTARKQEKRAMEKYAKLDLPNPNESCISCNGECEEACSHGVWTRPLVAMARQNMELAAKA